jgi:hypothetical protein
MKSLFERYDLNRCFQKHRTFLTAKKKIQKLAEIDKILSQSYS